MEIFHLIIFMRKIIFILMFFPIAVLAQPNFTVIDSTMVFVKGGSFQMGSISGKSDEKPVHHVELNDFYISKYEVTQLIWKLMMKTSEGAKSDCDSCPVYDVSRESIQSFISKLNQLTGKTYRLPTEAEWEYAAAGGNSTKGYKYSGSNNLSEVAWYKDNAQMKTHPVGQLNPNELGLYDMSGNVWELCSDWYQKNFYKTSPQKNPQNFSVNVFRVVRGGSWRSEEQRCQVHARNRDVHDHHIGNGGFRLVLEL
jgi:formylglycine-generating enzyme required for sulfatase activity